MGKKPSDSEKKEPWEVIKPDEHPDPPGDERCPQCGWPMQISRENDKVYCTVCEKYKEDMEGSQNGHG